MARGWGKGLKRRRLGRRRCSRMVVVWFGKQEMEGRKKEEGKRRRYEYDWREKGKRRAGDS